MYKPHPTSRERLGVRAALPPLWMSAPTAQDLQIILNEAAPSSTLPRAEPMKSAPNKNSETAGEAVYPGKEAWKNEPGNRYTAEELREMARNWQIKITRPKSVHVRRAD
jgi:hypothetical protein